MARFARQKIGKSSIGKLYRSQSGIGLVEILVAMAIGLMLTAGVIHIFSGSRQTYRITENQSHLQENGRIALIQLGNTLRMTGYKTDPTDTNTFATGAVSGTEAAGTPDQISVFYQGASDGTTFDCLGNSVDVTDDVSVDVENQFSIDSNNLKCQSIQVETDSSTDPPTITTTTSTQNLIENVEDMQITYGVDANGTGSANYYVDASSVTNWSQVVSLRVSLLFRSEEDNLAPAAQTYQYDGTATTATDRRLRAVFNTTIALRNLLP